MINETLGFSGCKNEYTPRQLPLQVTGMGTKGLSVVR